MGGNAGTWAVPSAPPGPSALRIPNPERPPPSPLPPRALPRAPKIGKKSPWRLSRLMASAGRHKVSSSGISLES